MILKPILFNTEMVRAILDGRKTQTRRVIKYGENPHIIGAGVYRGLEPPRYGAELETHGIVVAPYQPHDILYVRETWAPILSAGEWEDTVEYAYKANPSNEGVKIKWRPSIHMPKEAARIFLRVTEVRIERLRDITLGEIRDEGNRAAMTYPQYTVMTSYEDIFQWFIRVWDSTVKPADLARYGWSANPWVWVFRFERIGREQIMEVEE